MKTPLALLSALLVVFSVAVTIPRAHGQSVVQVGAGSYASTVPPACANTDSYYGLPASQVTGSGGIYSALHLDPSLVGKPIPTNHWWTDLLVADRSYLPAGQTQYVLQQDLYGGTMWFYPGRLNPQEYGFDIYYPNAWEGPNANGTPNAVIDSGPALQVHGDRGYSVPAADVLVADFENSYPAGWTVTTVPGFPNAFGTAPAQGNWTGQSPVPNGYLGNGLVNTYLTASNVGGNNNEGILSGTITIQKNYIHLLVAGGNDVNNTVVRLRVGGNIVATATGQQDATLRWASWNVSAYKNQTAAIEVVDTSSGGWGFIMCDEIVQSDVSDPVGRYGNDFSPTESIVTNWGDWNVDFKMPDGNGAEVDVTMARGIPFTWTVWKGGLQPRLYVSGTTPFYNTGNTQIAVNGGSFVSNAFSFNYQGRTYGVFLPDNTTVLATSGYIEPQLSGTNNYMVIGYLPAASNLAEFNNVAFARPTNTQIAWSYEPANGRVVTNWTITTTAMKGTNLNTIQGWLPHHYRTTTTNFGFSSYTYLTPRGTMQCATGTSFQIDFPFAGIAPVLPAPVATGIANDYQSARMQAYMNAFNPGTMIGDTYWSGKALAFCAQYMAWANQMGDTTNFNRLKGNLETAFTNWLTYTPGETQGLFAYYPDWHALIGWDASYGSQAFNDLHFHYGYFATAFATLAMYDPQFAANYSQIMKMIVKCYGNYDRTDTTEPFLRTFDVWEGHSNAGGVSSGNGENQESSSEAVQSWGGMFLLGSVLNDGQMQAAGAMGFAMESAATNEYWEDLWLTNFPSAYGRANAGQVYGDSYNYGTFFSADPAWVYAIQYAPSNHWLNYMTVRQPSIVSAKYQAMWNERSAWGNSYPTWAAGTAYPQYTWVKYNSRVYGANNAVPAGHASPDVNTTDWSLQADFSKSEPDILGDSPGHSVLVYQALFDPNTAASEFDNYYNAGEAIASVNSQAGSTYYLIHGMRHLGQQDITYHTSVPTSAVYYNAATGVHTYLVYNPAGTQQNVTVYQNGTSVGSFPVPAGATVSHHLDQTLTTLVLTPSSTAKTIQPGQTVQFTLVGYDQYGATYPLGTITWSVNAGGTINTSGLFTAATNADPVTVTASVGGKTQTYTFRVGPAPVLSSIGVTPAFARVIVGSTQQYGASGYDQYGDSFALGTVTWTAGTNGTIDASGLFTASTVGSAYVTASSGGIGSSVPVAVHTALTNIALGRTVTASSVNGANVGGNMVDGNTSTRWESAYTDAQWIYVDLGKVYDITNLNINWENAYASNYDVEVSNDAVNWSVVQSFTKNSNAAPDSLNIAGTGRYLKLNFTKRATQYGYSIWELQVYGYVNAASITPTKLMIAPGNSNTAIGKPVQFQAYNFDGNSEGGPVASAAWSVSGGGTISSAGLFSPNAAGGPYTVTATATVSGTTGITVGGGTPVNLALNKTATASAVENGGTLASYAVDGSLTTRWSSAFNDNQWLTVDLGSAKSLSQVVIHWETAYGKQYLIQGSNDNTNWTTLFTQNNGAGGQETIPVSGSYRYVKMQGVLRGTQWGYSIWEFEVY